MDNNLLAEAAKSGVFNAVVHRQDELGDPIRKADGEIALKTNWKEVAVDRQGRKYNAHVHGDKLMLDTEGYLKVRHREANATVRTIGRTEALVAKYRENGYAYYIANDDGGNIDRMRELDWEPVLEGEGSVTMNVGQARAPNTRAVLFRKPEEWYKADQEAKVERNKARFEETKAPSEEDGQYEATATSPLR